MNATSTKEDNFHKLVTTALDIVREFFPEASNDDLDYILWEETGFPCFWPDDNKTPEENLREQLAELKARGK